MYVFLISYYCFAFSQVFILIMLLILFCIQYLFFSLASSEWFCSFQFSFYRSKMFSFSLDFTILFINFSVSFTIIWGYLFGGKI